MTTLAQKTTSNWDLHITARGTLAAVATVPGCLNSHFGDRLHVRQLMQDYKRPDDFIGWTDAGLEYMAGLYSRIPSRTLNFAKK